MSCAERLSFFKKCEIDLLRMPCASFPVEDKHCWCELKQKSKLSLLKKSITRLSNQLKDSKIITAETVLMH
jgi:tmRNA-binding protein